MRRATGLVREISVWDAFNINLTNANAWANIAVLLPLGLAIFAGANLWLSVATGLVGGLAVVLVYAMLAQAMPRSGGDYVFISRVLHPSLGFLGSWTMMVLCAFFVGYNAWSIASWGIPDLMGPLGVMTGHHWMVTVATDMTHRGVVVVVELVFFAMWFWIMTRGAKSAARTQWLPTILTVAATALALPVLLFTSAHTYLHNFNAFAAHFHTSAAQVEAAAVKGGANLHPGFSLSETIAFWPFVMVIFGFSINSIMVGGEVRNPRRSQYVSVLGATLIAGLVLVLFLALGVARIPSALLNATGYATYVNPAVNPFPFPLYAHVPFALGMHSPVLLILLCGAVSLGQWGSSIGLLFWASRYMLAWSMDGVAPRQFGYVSPKRNSPTVALGVTMVVVTVFGVLLEYDSAITFVAGGLLQACLLLFACVAGIVFPYRLRALYKGSGGGYFHGVPWITIVSVFATAFMIVTVAFYAGNAKFGTVTGSSLWFSIIVLALGLLYYAGAWLLARARGADLGLAYRELPPE